MIVDYLWLVLFWGAIAIILYTYFGFPALLALRSLLFRRPVKREPVTPSVSILIAAHNEEAMIVRRLDNVYALEYPSNKLQVIVASDGSDDRTEELVSGYAAPNLALLSLPRRGKNYALNAAAAEATGEVLVFTDADTIMARESLRHLIAPFADPDVGGVGGDYRYATDIVEGEGERTYWGYDRVLKHLQTVSGSMTSATGQIYAVRRELFQPIPPGVTDDFYCSSQVPSAKKRLVFEPQALAFGPVADSAEAEFKRKVRSITTGLRGVWRMRHMLNPLEYRFYAVQLLSHKLLRRLMVAPLLLLLIGAPMLWTQGVFYQLAAAGQAGFYAAGLLGFYLRRTRLGQQKILLLPFFFIMVNVATAVALYNLIRRRQRDVWAPYRPGSVQLSPRSSEGGD